MTDSKPTHQTREGAASLTVKWSPSLSGRPAHLFCPHQACHRPRACRERQAGGGQAHVSPGGQDSPSPKPSSGSGELVLFWPLQHQRDQ